VSVSTDRLWPRNDLVGVLGARGGHTVSVLTGSTPKQRTTGGLLILAMQTLVWVGDGDHAPAVLGGILMAESLWIRSFGIRTRLPSHRPAVAVIPWPGLAPGTPRSTGRADPTL